LIQEHGIKSDVVYTTLKSYIRERFNGKA
jgi:hypothetical protein